MDDGVMGSHAPFWEFHSKNSVWLLDTCAASAPARRPLVGMFATTISVDLLPSIRFGRGETSKVGWRLNFRRNGSCHVVVVVATETWIWEAMQLPAWLGSIMEFY